MNEPAHIASRSFLTWLLLAVLVIGWGTSSTSWLASAESGADVHVVVATSHAAEAPPEVLSSSSTADTFGRRDARPGLTESVGPYLHPAAHDPAPLYVLYRVFRI